MDRPLHWLVCWTQGVIRIIADIGEGVSAYTFLEELEACPQECRAIPALIALWQQAQGLARAVLQDEQAGRLCPEANEVAFREFLQVLDDALEEERGHLRRDAGTAWGSWILEANNEHKGWAHRWTTVKEGWKPTRASPTFTGKPLDALMHERERLCDVWQCTEHAGRWFEPTDEEWRKLPAVTIENFLRAAPIFLRGPLKPGMGSTHATLA